ncbi:MAG TPA: FHA domain-containing protein [Kofleriaceae bacterium]|nr:FHA domain-containing protein [Kofleriaceae bacterium]
MSRVRVLQLAALATVFAVVALPRVARAQISSWQIVETAPGEPTEKVKNPPPVIKVKVVGEPAPKEDEKGKFKLEDTDQKKKMKGVAPTTVIPFHKSSDSLAIVVLVEGHQYYFGNDKYTQAPPPPAEGATEQIRIITKVSKGVYDVIVNALDAPAGKEDETPTTISSAGNPSGSKGSLIVYSVGADVRYPMGPLKDLTGEKLGAQELQKGKTSRELAEGLRESLAQLKKASATRRVLFVISDGFDANPEEIKNIRKQFDNEKIDIFAFHLEAGSDFIAGDDPQKNAGVMKSLGQGGDGNYFKIKDAADLTTKLTTAVTSINSRFYMIFPGQLMDAKTKLKSGFDWDGKEHELVLMKDDEPVTEKNQSVVLMPVWGQSKGGSLWWLWIAIPGGLVVLIGLVALLTRKKPQPAPMPMPMMAPPPQQQAAAPPPQIQAAPAQANKTMAINISSGDGVPVVGWIVPINGPQQYQTFKLFAGVTKVGNTHGAHIVINDGFMSSEHAQIAMSPNGFTLIDNNSTNGTFVNERRVQRHELIDNDVIKFGKTDCKFKTINT